MIHEKSLFIPPYMNSELRIPAALNANETNVSSDYWISPSFVAMAMPADRVKLHSLVIGL